MAQSNDNAMAMAWLVQATDDNEIAGLRDEVGRVVLGEQSDWYQDPDKVSDLADTLGANSALISRLHAVSSRDDQVAWLETVVQTAQGAPNAQSPGQSRYSEPEYDEDYRLYYRFDEVGSVYEWCVDPHASAPEWMSQSAADAMVAQRGSQEAAQGDPGASEQPGHSAEPEWAWDDGWGMFYRVGAAGVYEYSHSVDEAHSRPDGVWLSGEQVAQQRQRGGAEQVGQNEQVEQEKQAGVTGGTAQGEQAAKQGAKQGEHGAPAPSPDAAGPMDVESALAAFEQVGVPALRGVVEDVEAVFAELSRLGVA
ncbi:MAG TPA: hypothetical protein VGM10_07585 [Actinocrinis sp.]|jgi:hypothetical protein